jgi:hypothetical protein
MWRRTPQPIGLRVLEEHNADLHGGVVESGLHAWAWGSFHDVMPGEIGALVEFYKKGDPAQQQEKIQLKEHMDKKVALNLETAKKDYESWGAFRKGLFVSHKSGKLNQRLLHLDSEMNSDFNGRITKAALAMQRGGVQVKRYRNGLGPNHIYHQLTNAPLLPHSDAGLGGLDTSFHEGDHLSLPVHADPSSHESLEVGGIQLAPAHPVPIAPERSRWRMGWPLRRRG